MTRLLRSAGAVTAALGFLTVASCSNKIETLPETGATLEGTVTYGKESVPVAMIIVTGSGSPSATGMVGPDGRYKVENVPLGEVQVAVNTDAAKGMMIGQRMAQSQGKAKGAGKVVDVPQKFHDPTTSGITTTVKGGANTFDIVIPK
jgi:hypothetical protein